MNKLGRQSLFFAFFSVLFLLLMLFPFGMGEVWLNIPVSDAVYNTTNDIFFNATIRAERQHHNNCTDVVAYLAMEGDAQDYCLDNNDGIIGNGSSNSNPMWTADGKVGGAYIFSGNSYTPKATLINITNSSWMDGVGKLTISVWVKPYHSGGTGMVGIVSKYGVGEPAQENWYLALNDATNALRMQNYYICDGGSVRTVNTVGTLADGEWTHIVVRKNETAVAVFINGIEDSSTRMTENYCHGTGNVRIGSRGSLDSGSEAFNGTIDEVKILWNVSWSDAEIQNDYIRGFGSYIRNASLIFDNVVVNNTDIGNAPKIGGYEDDANLWYKHVTAGIFNWAMRGNFNQSIYFNNKTDMVLQMPFDGSAADFSGNSNHGTLNDAVLVDGFIGKGYYFNTSTKVSLAHTAAFNLSTFEKGFTISAWAKPIAFGGEGTKIFDSGVCTMEGPANYGTVRMEFDWSLHRASMVVTNTTEISAPTLGLTGTTVAIAGNWYHVVGVYDRSLGNLSIYVNGIFEKSIQDSGFLNLRSCPLPYYIGFDNYNKEIGSMNGTIDQFYIFNRSLSASEIKAIYELEANGYVQSENRSITISDVAPTFTSFANFSLNEDFGSYTLNLTNNITGAEPVVVQYTPNSTNYIIVNYVNTTKNMTFYSVTNIFGSTLINLNISNSVGSVYGSFIVTVDAVNDVPYFIPTGDFTYDEDFIQFSIDLTGNISDIEDTNDANLRIQYILNRTDLLSVTLNNATSTITFTSFGNKSGVVNISLIVIDLQGASTPIDFDFIVNAVNDNPFFTPMANFTIDEDFGTYTLEFATNITDNETADADMVTQFTLNSTNYLTVTYVNATQTLTLHSVGNVTGWTNIILTTFDIETANATISFDVNVTGVNDAPTAPSLLVPLNYTWNAVRNPFMSWANSSDIDSPTLTYAIIIDNNSGFSNPEYANHSMSLANVTTDSLITDGDYYWKVLSNDGSLNSTWSETYIYRLDSTKPIPTFEMPTFTNNSYSNSLNYILINVSLGEINFANLTFTLFNSSSLLNRTTYTTATFSINFTNIAMNEIYYYNVSVADLANNKNWTETRTLTFDNIKPNIILFNYTDYKHNNEGSQNFTYNISENFGISNCTLTLGGNSWLDTSIDSSQDELSYYISKDEGSYTWWITCYDMASNYNASEVRNIVLESTATDGSVGTGGGSSGASYGIGLGNITAEIPSRVSIEKGKLLIKNIKVTLTDGKLHSPTQGISFLFSPFNSFRLERLTELSVGLFEAEFTILTGLPEGDYEVLIMAQDQNQVHTKGNFTLTTLESPLELVKQTALQAGNNTLNLITGGAVGIKSGVMDNWQKIALGAMATMIVTALIFGYAISRKKKKK